MDGKNYIDNQVARNCDKLSEGAKLAIVLCASAFRFGANWAMLKATDPELNAKMDALKTERKAVTALKLSNGILVRCNEDFLAQNINALIPNAINGTFIDMKKGRLAKEHETFEKFVEKVANGKDTHIVAKNGYYDLTLGIYSVNDVNTIVLGGIEYPAYKLSLMEALQVMHANKKLTGKVYAKAVTKEGKVVFDIIENVANSNVGVTALYKGLEISDTGTGVFLSLRIKRQ